MGNAIEINNLTFAYKDQTDRNALDNLSLEIARGEFLVILGPSGAGKSTLANCLNGIIPALTCGKLSGTVAVNGINYRQHQLPAHTDCYFYAEIASVKIEIWTKYPS